MSSCCGGDLGVDNALNSAGVRDVARVEELQRAGHTRKTVRCVTCVSVPDIHCGACISAIERGLNGLDGIVSARVNLSLKRLTVILDNAERSPGFVLSRLDQLGYDAAPVDLGDLGNAEQKRKSDRLLKALAVAGFAAGNIMLLSVSVWSGASGATRDLFPSDLRPDRHSGRRLFRPGLLPVGLPGAGRTAAQHGCADLARGHPCTLHERL
jgi:Cu2+-exporting ATPase